MKRRGLTAVCILTAILQAALAAAGVVLSRLAYQKAGVNHHVAFQKRRYNALIFTQGKVILMALVLALAALFLAAVLIRMARRGRRGAALCAGWSLVLTAVLLFALLSPTAQAIAIYPYAVLLAALCWALSLVPLGLSVRLR